MAIVTEAGVEFLDNGFLDKLKDVGSQIGGDTSAIIEKVRSLLERRNEH